LTVSGLPTATFTDITIHGPAGFSLTEHLGPAPVTLTDLAPGAYTIAAVSLTTGGVTYVPIPGTQTAHVTAAGTASAAVGFGSLVFVPNMRAEDVTPDGNTALLTDANSTTADFYFYNLKTNTNTLKTSPGDALFNFASGISSTLRVSAIHGKPELAGMWDAGGWADLGNIYPNGCEYDDVTHEQNQGGAFDISADGSVAVGLVWNLCDAQAFLWSDAVAGGSFIPLDLLGAGDPNNPGEPPSSRATKVSDDGSVAGGFASVVATVGGNPYWIDRWPAIWQADGTGMLIPSNGVFTDDSPGEVLSISADGSMVAGTWNFEGWYWTQAGGVVKLGTPAGGQTFPNAIAANGQLIFGGSSIGMFDPQFPFVWTAGGGILSLVDIATANGVEIPAGFYLDNVKAASADGTVLVGNAYDDFFTSYTFVLRLPVSVYDL
jgi:hypothetical protein